jgi:hypothetical protein
MTRTTGADGHVIGEAWGRAVVSAEAWADGWAEAEALLKTGKYRRGALRTNPITDCAFVHGIDRIDRQIREAAKALWARAWFAELNPGLPALPLCYSDREKMKRAHPFDMAHLVSWFARSLEAHRYNFDTHSTFEDYARDVLVDQRLRSMFDPEIAARYPPRPKHLRTLDPGYTYALPPRKLRKPRLSRAR